MKQQKKQTLVCDSAAAMADFIIPPQTRCDPSRTQEVLLNSFGEFITERTMASLHTIIGLT